MGIPEEDAVSSPENQFQLGREMPRFERDFLICCAKFDHIGICGSALFTCSRKTGIWGKWWVEIVFEELGAGTFFVLRETWQEEWAAGWGWERQEKSRAGPL